MSSRVPRLKCDAPQSWGLGKDVDEPHKSKYFNNGGEVSGTVSLMKWVLSWPLDSRCRAFKKLQTPTVMAHPEVDSKMEPHQFHSSPHPPNTLKDGSRPGAVVLSHGYTLEPLGEVTKLGTSHPK